jgi:transposase
MIKNGEFYMIHEMKKRGMNITQIADELGRDRKTIRKWLQKSELVPCQRQIPRPGKLEPFKDYIRQRMQEGCLNANVIFDEIRAKGYTGRKTILPSFMQPLRPTVIQKATVRFETPPGYQAQVDWGRSQVDWNGNRKRLYAFVMVLGYSRMMYVEFTEDEKLETLIGCHLRAFEYFGGRPEVLLYDNMKTIVTGFDERGNAVWNERFSRFAAHHGFVLRNCRPYRARTKGKVENGIRYVRQNFWPRIREFTGLDDLNQQVRHWLDTVANIRVHGTTHEVPYVRLSAEKLKPINRTPFAEVDRHARKVSTDGMVSYGNNRYSVPFLWVGQTVHIQDQKNGRIRIFSGDQLIAEHPKSHGKQQCVINKKHFEGLRTTGKHKVPKSMPRMVRQATPEVAERDLSVYEQLLNEAVTVQ